MKKKKPLTVMSIVEYTDKNFHKFTASTQEADSWAASIMAEHGSHNVRITIGQVLFSIDG